MFVSGNVVFKCLETLFSTDIQVQKTPIIGCIQKIIFSEHHQIIKPQKQILVLKIRVPPLLAQ